MEEEEESLAPGDELKTKFFSVPYFWTVQFGQSLRFAGYNKDFDDVIIHGRPVVDSGGENPDPVFVAFYVKEGRVVAAASLNMDPLVAQFAETMRNGIVVKPDLVRESPEGFVHLLKQLKL